MLLLLGAGLLPHYAWSAIDLAKINSLKNENTGEVLKLNWHSSKALVFIAFLDGCPLLRKHFHTLKEIKKEFGQDVSWIILDSNKNPSFATYKEKTIREKIFPFVIDKDAVLAKELGISVASQVVVLRLPEFQRVYSGPVDDRLSMDYELPKADNKFLLAKLRQLQRGETPALEEIPTMGCELNL